MWLLKIGAHSIRLREILANDELLIDPMKTTWLARKAIEDIIESKIMLFGSNSKG